MNRLEFNGDWEFEIETDYFSQVRSKGIARKEAKGATKFKIQDRRDLNPDPEESQFATLKYLLENEKHVVNSLLGIMKYKINPTYVGYCGEDEWVLPLETINDLGKTIRLDTIEILLDEKNGMSYYAIFVEYIGDEEHGLVLTMYEDQLIGFQGSCEVDYEKISLDRGPVSDEERERNLNSHSFGVGIFHHRLEKYDKLKPWQIDEMGQFLHRLLSDSDDGVEVIKNAIEDGTLDVNIPVESYWGNNLIGLAIHHKKIDFMKYLLDKGADGTVVLSNVGSYKFDYQIIELLTTHGVDIDTINRRGQTLLMQNIQEYYSKWVQMKVQESRNNEISSFVENCYSLQRDIEFLLSLGANPMSCNTKKQSYIEVLTNYNPSFIKKFGSLEQLDLIINPRKRTGWQFWNQ